LSEDSQHTLITSSNRKVFIL